MTSLPQKLQQLRLSAMSRELDRVLAESFTKNLSLPATLEWLANLELESRDQRAIQRRFQLSVSTLNTASGKLFWLKSSVFGSSGDQFAAPIGGLRRARFPPAVSWV